MFKKLKKFIKYSPRKFFFILSAVLVLLIGLCFWRLGISGSLFYPLWLLCVSIVTFLFYGYDKRQANTSYSGYEKHDKNEPFVGRVPEIVLHVLSLVGGFIGGYFGRKVFRHKTQKPLFMVVIVLAACLHIAFALWLYL